VKWQGLTLALAAGVEGSDVLLFAVEETWGDNQPSGQYNHMLQHNWVIEQVEGWEHETENNQMSAWATTANQRLLEKEPGLDQKE